jgi:hypothetical protein
MGDHPVDGGLLDKSLFDFLAGKVSEFWQVNIGRTILPKVMMRLIHPARLLGIVAEVEIFEKLAL